MYCKNLLWYCIPTYCFVLCLGAALGPLLTGLISPTGWQNVFYMLIAADVCAFLVSRNA